MKMKGFVVGTLLFLTLPLWVVIAIVGAGLLVVWEIGQILAEGINGK
jgi:hypothetical protein